MHGWKTVCLALNLSNKWDLTLHHVASLVAQTVKNLLSTWKTQVWCLEKGMAIHSSILAWRILWTENPGGLCLWHFLRASLEAQMVKNLPTMQKTRVQPLFLNASVSFQCHTVLLLFKSFLSYMRIQVLVFCLVFGAFLHFQSQILALSLNSESVSLLRDVTPTGWKSGLAGCFSFLCPSGGACFLVEKHLYLSQNWMDAWIVSLFFCFSSAVQPNKQVTLVFVIHSISGF